MRLNILRFKVLASKRHLRKENIPIGSAIKFKRHELKMTLEEASKDICSISYLSKLENNIIVPSEKYVIELKKRFLLEENHSTFDEDLYQALKKKVIRALFNGRHLSEHFLLQIDEQKNYQTLLLKFAYYILKNTRDECYQLYHQIIPVMTSMPDEEFAMMVCLMGKLLHDEARYQESTEVLAMMPKENIHLSLMLFRDKWMLINALHMENHALFHLIYPSYQQSLLKLGYYKQINELKCYSLMYYAHLMSISAYQEVIDDHVSIPKPFLILSIANNLLANHQYEAVIKYINRQSMTHNDDLFILKLIALDGLKNKKEITQLIQTNKHRKYSDNHLVIIQYLRAKYVYDKKMLLAYLRAIILGDGFLTDDVRVLKYIQHGAQALFREFFYYKEATEVYLKFHRMIEHLKKADYRIKKGPKALFI